MLLKRLITLLENGIFAFAVFLWIYGAAASRWFAMPVGGQVSVRNELLLGFLLGICCWLRPEGFVVVGVALVYRVMRPVGSRPEFTVAVRGSVIFLVPLLILAAGLAWFHFSQTGELLPTSGMSRILMSKLDSNTFLTGPLFFSPKFAVRLAAYFPLTIMWLVCNWIVLTRSGTTLRSNEVVLFLIFLFWTTFW